MGGARDAGWVAAGLVLGAGACYCIYRLTRGPRPGGRKLRPSRSAGEALGRSAGAQVRGSGPPRWAGLGWAGRAGPGAPSAVTATACGRRETGSG